MKTRSIRWPLAGLLVFILAACVLVAGGATSSSSDFFEPKSFAEITDEDWLRFFDVNVLSGVRLSRFYLPKMLPKNWGRIVFISSESGINLPVEMVHYGLTKTAKPALARGLAEMTAEPA